MSEIHETDNRNTQHPITEPAFDPTGKYPYAGDRDLPPVGTLGTFLSRMGTTESVGAPKETPASQSSKYHINTTGLDYTLDAGKLTEHRTVNNKHDVLVHEPALELQYGGSAYIADTANGATEWRINMQDPDGSVEVTRHTMRREGDVNRAVESHRRNFESEGVPHDANKFPNAYKSPYPYYEDPAFNLHTAGN